ncbi:hypothetical protein C7S18_17485 [Ahniella affigens]|uniref:Uncharacterized protein n=1 Tax=Ahniella affigens TaxID=2021234 RepID=A0A2P1PVJ0_9GAMM|nr:DUF6491 family protein [Ahniella affigens]AVP98859.1 hypothetical protein C7S18_17485 [Ahniella affigens]
MKLKHRPLLLSLALSAAVFAAGVANAKRPNTDIDYESLAGPTVAFIEQRNIDRFDHVDDYHMVVYASRKNAYLLTFNSICRRYTLQDPMVIERTSTFRLYPEDRISINGAPCLIKDIRVMDVNQLKAARASAKR